MESGVLLYALPVTVGGILVAIFFDFSVGVLFALMTSLLIGILVRDNLAMAVLALVGNLVATFRVQQYRQRSSILLTGLFIGLANILTLMAFRLDERQPLHLADVPMKRYVVSWGGCWQRWSSQRCCRCSSRSSNAPQTSSSWSWRA